MSLERQGWKVETHPELGTVGIVWDRDIYLHVISRTPSFELRDDFDHILHATSFVTFHSSFYPYQRLDGCGKAVGHEFELPIWRNERDGPVVLEP